jgi:hypothetical protein
VLYSADEAAAASGLSPTTIRNYTSRGMSDLLRGTDFIVKRRNQYHKDLRITDAGLQRLVLRQYRTCAPRPYRVNPIKFARVGLSISPWKSEKVQQFRALFHQVMRDYEATPCAVAGCPCIIHRLGVPQIEVMLEVFAPRQKKPGKV